MADVARLGEALTAAGYPAHRIATMTEDGVRSPTRTHVLEALEALATAARPGQEILIYFSGHGAQAAARHPDREVDGLEELYLLADAGPADPSTGRVPGTLADFELEAVIARIRQAGADVILIADACHASGLTRSGERHGRVKGLTGVDLGMPDVFPLRSRPAPDAQPVRGDFTGIFAASPGRLAVERRLPLGEAGAQPASAFTFALARAIRDGRHRSWRDLQDGVRDASVEAGPGPVPVFEGRLDAVPAGLDRDRPRLFRAYDQDGMGVITAGRIEGFSPGERVELLDLDGRVMGQTTVTASQAFSARLAAPANGARRARHLNDIPGSPFLDRIGPYLETGSSDGSIRVSGHVQPSGCGSAVPPEPASAPVLRIVDLSARPALSHCDVLHLQLKNDNSAALDAALFFVNAQGRATPLTFGPDNDPRLEPGQARHAAVRIVTRDPQGRRLASGEEAIVLMWVPARGRIPRDLRAVTRGVMRGSLLTDDLRAIVFPVLTSDSTPAR
jgi:hypothetical protein